MPELTGWPSIVTRVWSPAPRTTKLVFGVAENDARQDRDGIGEVVVLAQRDLERREHRNGGLRNVERRAGRRHAGAADDAQAREVAFLERDADVELAAGGRGDVALRGLEAAAVDGHGVHARGHRLLEGAITRRGRRVGLSVACDADRRTAERSSARIGDVAGDGTLRDGCLRYDRRARHRAYGTDEAGDKRQGDRGTKRCAHGCSFLVWECTGPRWAPHRLSSAP
jgi:hypothetical protein